MISEEVERQKSIFFNFCGNSQKNVKVTNKTIIIKDKNKKK